MKPYFTWKAMFDKDTELYQFMPDGKETLFKAVEEGKDHLVKFRIEAKDGEYYEVDLKKCEIDCNGKSVQNLKTVVDNAKLIYSRRNKVRANPQTGKILEQRVIHRVGLESDEESLVVEVFPGLEMAERKVEVVMTYKESKEGTRKDITKDVK